MEIKNVIVRKPVSVADAAAGLFIIMSLDNERLGKCSPRESIHDWAFALGAYIKANQAAKLLGFDSFDSMQTFTEMFGIDAL